jgi:ABC-three component (ABC-3C) system Middle Component 3
MKNLIEPEIVQNEALGALLLWAFTNQFCTKQPAGVGILWLLPVLPLAFHKDTIEAVSNRHFNGGIYLALTEDRTLVSGLQERMEAMVPQTFAALNLALSTKLLKLDESKRQVTSIRRTPPLQVGQRTKPLISTAERFGYWFGNSSPEEVTSLLRLRF